VKGLGSILRRHYLLLAVGPLALAGMLLGVYFMVLSLGMARDVEQLRAGQAALRVQDAVERLFGSLRDAQLQRDLADMRPRERREVLLVFMSGHPMVRRITLIGADGRELLDLSDHLPDRLDSGESWRERPEFAVPAAQGEVYVSGVVRHPDSGEPGLNLAWPFMDPVSGRVRSVAALHLQLSALLKVVAGYALLPGETLFLAEEDGAVIVHPDTSLVLSGAAAAPPGPLGFARAPGGGGPQVRAQSLLTLGGRRFLVVADRSLYEALGPAMNGATLLAALLFSAAGLAFVLAARSREVIERPLLRLAETARAIGAGEAGRRADTGGYAEADLLARAFNGMTDRLERAREVLELEMAGRAKAQSALERSEALLKLHLDTTPVGCIFFDAEGRITAWNPAAERIFGWKGAEVLGGNGADVLLLPEERGQMLETFRDILERGRAITVNRNRTRDGRIITCEWHSSRLTENGQAVGVASLVLDVTERLAAESRLYAGLREKETLLQEVHHRVKNNMQIISSLLSLQAGRHPDPRFREMADESIARIRSMALVHEKLYRARSMSEVDLAGYLQTLVGKLAASLGEGGRFTAATECGEVSLGIGQAVPVGLIVNELVINAFKHAFAGRASGLVRVRAETRDGEAVLTVSDDGLGMPPGFAPERAEGLGWQIVTGLTEQLRGRLDVTPGEDGGATVRIVFPLADAVPPRPGPAAPGDAPGGA